MAKYVFNGAYSRYYPTIPLFTKNGEVHEIAAAPDADWSLVEDAVTAAVAPVATPVAQTAPATVEAAQPTATAVETTAEDALKAAEALLEANPELARKLVEDVKNA